MKEDVEKLILQAVINKKFMKILLKSPGTAIEKFTADHAANFSKNEIEGINGIHADSLSEFSQACIDQKLV